jgi:hypothetical protein
MADEARARFVRALYELVVSTGSLQERVSAAWLELLPLRQDDLPPPLQAAYAAIEADVLAAPEDPAALSEEQAVAATERLVRLVVELGGAETVAVPPAVHVSQLVNRAYF